MSRPPKISLRRVKNRDADEAGITVLVSPDVPRGQFYLLNLDEVLIDGTPLRDVIDIEDPLEDEQ